MSSNFSYYSFGSSPALFPVNPLCMGLQFESGAGKADSDSDNENYNIERQLQNANTLNRFC